MQVTGQMCACGCGQPATRSTGHANPCYRRWIKAGRPETGPPPPLSTAARNRQRAAAQASALTALAERRHDDDGTAAARERRQRKADRQARAQAAALARCLAAGDRKGVRELRLRAADWDAVLALLPALTPQPPARTGPPADDGARRRAEAVTAALDAIRALREGNASAA
ncbi:MAG: hypothetical protein ACLQFR_07635 [Streptosporangiaceae bacterium]